MLNKGNGSSQTAEADWQYGMRNELYNTIVIHSHEAVDVSPIAFIFILKRKGASPPVFLTGRLAPLRYKNVIPYIARDLAPHAERNC